MTEYLLFIDTETSGLPVNWGQPYAKANNWPHAVQVSWLIYNPDRSLLKKENHYIKNNGFTISPQATAIHGITDAFLTENGKDSLEVLQLLAVDLLKYRPMVIGHFALLDYHVLGAEYYRLAMSNPMRELPVFCTMMATRQLVWNPMPRYLRLEDLYCYLFCKDLLGQHNAINDAQGTADCFFELLNRNEVNEGTIERQTARFEKSRYPENSRRGCLLPLAAVFLLLLFIIWIL